MSGVGSDLCAVDNVRGISRALRVKAEHDQREPMMPVKRATFTAMNSLSGNASGVRLLAQMAKFHGEVCKTAPPIAKRIKLVQT